jgi:hypothetical protein
MKKHKIQVKMKLMYALAQQLSDKSLDEGIFHSKVQPKT